MADAMAVAICDRGSHLPNAARCVALRVPSSPRKPVEEVGATHPLHDEAKVTGLLEDFKESADVGVVHHQLILHLRHHLRERPPPKALGAQCLHGDLGAGGLGDRHHHTPGHPRAEHDALPQGVPRFKRADILGKTAEANARLDLQGLQDVLGRRRLRRPSRLRRGPRNPIRHIWHICAGRLGGILAFQRPSHGQGRKETICPDLHGDHLHVAVCRAAEHMVQDDGLGVLAVRVHTPVGPIRLPPDQLGLRRVYAHKHILELQRGKWRAIDVARPYWVLRRFQDEAVPHVPPAEGPGAND
mmetsp:Transcript_79862/g.224152  ORF Transcript_79862/g.224152 Transcript_79862/m.224152 type:complete len:300 (+) Transcript_79862:392-1291(+)